VKTLLAVIGGSALVSLGAVGFVIAQGQPQSPQMMSSGTMNMGQTSTVETPPPTPDTSVAEPAVKAGG
jgi:hypothetical protein